MENKKTKSGITPEQIEAWKKKYGNVFVVEADGKKGYIRAPKRAEVGMATAYQATSPFKATEFILQNCWLGGDEVLMNEDRYFYGLNAQIAEIIDVAEVQVKKL